MGICLAMVRLSDQAIDEICETPKKALHFWMQEEAPERPSGFLSRLFGAKEAPKCTVPREPGDETDLDKAWEAMDYLLSDGRKKEGISRFLTEGGEEVQEELGYGEPRVFRSSKVKEIDDYLQSVSVQALRAHYEPRAMDRAKIYPQIWSRDGEEGFEYVAEYFQPLRDFVSDATKRKQGLMIVYT